MTHGFEDELSATHYSNRALSVADRALRQNNHRQAIRPRPATGQSGIKPEDITNAIASLRSPASPMVGGLLQGDRANHDHPVSSGLSVRGQAKTPHRAGKINVSVLLFAAGVASFALFIGRLLS